MKKLFLFMLTALLSVTAWAGNIADVPTFIINSFVYGSAYNTTTDLVVTANDGITALVKGTDYTLGATIYTDEECTTPASSNAPKELHVGTYWVRVMGIGTFEGSMVKSFDVNTKELTLTTKALNKIYGASDPAFGYTQAADVTGIVGTDNVGLTVTRETGENVGDYSYIASVSNTDYTIVLDATPKKFTINQKDLSTTASFILTTESNDYTSKSNPATVAVTVASNVTTPKVLTAGTDYAVKYYSDAAKTTEVLVADLKNAGTYYMNVEGAGNYTGTFAVATTTTYKINKIGAVVQFGDVTKTYDGTTAWPDGDPKPTSFAGITTDDLAAFAALTADATTKKNAGTYNNEVTTTDATLLAINPNYNYTIYAGKLVINKRTFTLTPANLAVEYGTESPAYTYNATGLAAGETISDAFDATGVTCKATAYSKTSSPGTYTISITGGTAKANYNAPTRKTGTLTVNKNTSEVTFYAFNTSKTYGDADPAVFGASNSSKLKRNTEFFVTGLVSDADLKAKPVLTRAEGEDAGTYAISIAAGATAPVDAAKYSNVKYLDGTFTINKAEIEVTVKNQTLNTAADVASLALDKTSGVAYKISGLKNGEAESVLAGTFTVDGSVVTDPTVTGTYADAIKYAVGGGANYVLKAGSGLGKLKLVALGTVILNDDAKIVTTAANPKDVTFSSTRKLNGGQWNVLVLPFVTSAKQISQALDYAVVDTFDETADDGNAHFKLNVTNGVGTKVIAANTPFLVYPTADIDLSDVTFSGVNVKAATGANVSVTDQAGVKFVGTYDATEINGSDKWYMSGGKFYDAGAATFTIGRLRAYLDFSGAAAGVRAIFIEEPDGTDTVITTDGVTSINADEKSNTVEGIYNLSGVRVNKAQKGIYIINGKKVVK